MVNKDGKYEYSAVKTVDNSSSLYVSIYPNPAIDKLIVQTDSEKETTVQLQIVGMNGKTILAKQGKVSAGQQQQSVNVSALQKGSYFLKITTGTKEQTVIKFQKL